MVTVSVPGKVHLMGEHTVVYGKPALLAAVDRRLTVSISQSDVLVIQSTEPTSYAQFALLKVCEHFSLTEIPPMQIDIHSDIPAGFHLGSSAAVAVGVVGAAAYFLKKVWNPQLVNTIAYEVEKKQHGNPSGGDNTAVTMGGFLWYRKELEFLKSMWQLDMQLPLQLNHFYLLDTGRPVETTGEMVSYVRSQFIAHGSQYKKLFDTNEEETKAIALAIKMSDEKQLMSAMQKGEKTLEGIGVVGKKVIPMIRAIEQEGGAVKILGGGGRKAGVGFLLCYHPDEKIVIRLSKKYSSPSQHVTLGCEGMKLERKE